MSADTETANLSDIAITKWLDREQKSVRDVVPVEEPLEIFIDDQPFYVTMRSPGEELPLALGLCFSEGIIDSMKDTMSVNYCKDISTNRINVYLSPGRREGGALKIKEKRSATYSSCGICGKELIEDICRAVAVIPRQTTVTFSELRKMQETLQTGQELHIATGGSHAAAIFTAAGDLLALSEDIGRHNALDKAIGKVLFADKASEASIVTLSSRLSYEMVQKAARLGAEILAGPSAPTSLGVEMARAANLTLIGFLRKGRCNVYTWPERIVFE